MIRLNLFIGLFSLLFVASVTGELPAQTGVSPQAIYSKVPGWVFDPIKNDPTRFLVLGISDPGLADSAARQQAFLRGVAMRALASGSEAAHLGDFFTNEIAREADSKYEEIYRFTAYYAGDLNRVRIIADTTLKSGEVVLLLEVPQVNPGNSPDSMLAIETFLYNHEFEVSGKRRMMKKYEFSVKLWMDEELFSLDKISFFRLNRKATGIESSFPQSQEAYDTHEYYYGFPGFPENDDSLSFAGTPTHQGLWISYLSQVLDHISFCVKQASNETARVTDYTSDLTKELNREREKLFLNWIIYRLIPGDQQLKVKLSCGTPVLNR